MEGGLSLHQLGDFEWLLYDIWGYGEDTQIFLQDLDDKVQIVLDWCEQVAHLLNVPPLVLPIQVCIQHFDSSSTLRW
jgi:hypothetical protein